MNRQHCLVFLGKTVEDTAAPDTAVEDKLDRAVGVAVKQGNQREYKDLHRGLGNQTDCKPLLLVENSQRCCTFARLKELAPGATLTLCQTS